VTPNSDYGATIPHLAFAVFQAMFATITVALIAGAVVERLKFRAYLAFVVLWATLVYDPLAHWVWGANGWLHALGALDFAGGTVVHVSAGASALVAALVLGRRQDAGRSVIVPHNVPFTLIGAGLLWFGWFGFNAGSALAVGAVATTAFVATHIAAASALATWVILDLAVVGRATAVGAATGAVVGLVAITPAAGYVTPLAAIVIGAAGAGMSFAAMQLRAKTRIDDALDVFACHGIGGITGALLTGVFASKAVNPAGADGWFYGDAHLMSAQLLAVLATLVLAGGMTFVTLHAIRLAMGLRVSIGAELRGLDVSEHGEAAYHGGDIGDLTGRRVPLGESVLLPASELGVRAVAAGGVGAGTAGHAIDVAVRAAS
jgi:Amt family ammonium transporter